MDLSLSGRNAVTDSGNRSVDGTEDSGDGSRRNIGNGSDEDIFIENSDHVSRGPTTVEESGVRHKRNARVTDARKDSLEH
mmetsp:Transcript_42264/g.77227  ORF Transcript_42264/g.77227 Transcript_42264/m.77227 type:complete len:80 (-) Transcript_42264:1028-1267(-)